MLGGSRNCRRTAARSSSWYRRTTCGRIPSTAYPAGGAKVPFGPPKLSRWTAQLTRLSMEVADQDLCRGRSTGLGVPQRREPPSPIAQNLQHDASARPTAWRQLWDRSIRRTLTFEPPTPACRPSCIWNMLRSLNFIGPPSGQRGWRPPSPAGPVRSAWRRAADSPLRSPPLDLRLWHTR